MPQTKEVTSHGVASFFVHEKRLPCTKLPQQRKFAHPRAVPCAKFCSASKFAHQKAVPCAKYAPAGRFAHWNNFAHWDDVIRGTFCILTIGTTS